MKSLKRTPQRAMIPTATMADIAFLLIIFFMLTIVFEVDKAQVELPRTVIREEIPRKSAYISITEMGTIRVSDGEALSVPISHIDDVLSFAASVVASDPSRAFVLKADEEVPYRLVDRVLDQLKQAHADRIFFLSSERAAEADARGGG